MRLIKNLTGIIAAVLLFTSCQRENETIEPVVLPSGGIGGKVTLNVTPQHHAKNIGNKTTVYLKYAADKMPTEGLKAFDNSITLNADGDAATFKGLTQGTYYIYAEGEDWELAPKNTTVIGGTDFTILDSTEKTYNIFVQLYPIE